MAIFKNNPDKHGAPVHMVCTLFFSIMYVRYVYIILPYINLIWYEENKVGHNKSSQKSTLNVSLILVNNLRKTTSS